MQVFILGDADRVREKVERALLDGNLGEVTYFSRNLTSAVEALVRDVEQAFEAITVFAGGDDVCFRAPRHRYSSGSLFEMAQKFAAATSCTISFGVGTTIQCAYLNLRRAKSRGGDQVVDNENA